MAYKFNPFTGKLDQVGAGGGGGGTPGGSNTQVQFNDGGTFGGDAGLTYNKTTDELTLAGDLNLDDGGSFSTTVQAVTPTANRTISFPDATGTVALVSGANGTIQYNDAGTLKGNSDFTVDVDWNNAATVFTGLKLNVTDGAGGSPVSATGSKMLDLQSGGTSRFNVDMFGIANVFVQAGFTNEGISIGATNSSAQTKLSFSDGLFFSGTGTYDIVLRGDGSADTLAQRRGTNAQTFRLYNTWANSGVDFERTSITRDSSGLVIDAQKGGTGADPTNLLDVKLDGATKAFITTSGRLGLGSGLNANNFIANGLSLNAGLALIGNNATGASDNASYGALVRGSQFWLNGSGYLGWSSSLLTATTPDVALARDSAGVLKITDGSTGTGYLRQEPIPVGDLPTAAAGNAGTRIFVSDSNVGAAGNFGAVVANGGSNVVPVYSDGGAWRIG